MTPQLEAAWKVHEALTALAYRYALIGGLAVQFWGHPRFTSDVDVTVLVEPGHEGALAAQLVERFSPRLPDAVEFALANRVLLLRVDDLCDLDLSFGIPGYETEVMDRAVPMDLGDGRHLTVISAEDLVIHKLVAGRPRDREDVRAILRRQGSKLDAELIEHWLEIFCELMETDEPRGALEELRAGL